MKSDTYSRVFEVADSLLAEGVRPTQQNVRDRLGKGSLSTIHKALGEWWQTLGQRLQRGRDYPDLPDGLSEMMISWWQNAVDRSRREFEGQQDQAQRQLKAVRVSHRDEIELQQTRLSEVLDKLSQQVGQQQQLYQQLHEAGQDRLALEQRVLNAESNALELMREAKINAGVITRLESENDLLRQQLKGQHSASGDEALQASLQENTNLRALVAELDSKYNKGIEPV
ncbi:MAG: hypothetical protein ACI9W6_002148 [Motiliproteus sp.]|jgi:hypothetical protein